MRAVSGVFPPHHAVHCGAYGAWNAERGRNDPRRLRSLFSYRLFSNRLFSNRLFSNRLFSYRNCKGQRPALSWRLSHRSPPQPTCGSAITTAGGSAITTAGGSAITTVGGSAITTAHRRPQAAQPSAITTATAGRRPQAAQPSPPQAAQPSSPHAAQPWPRGARCCLRLRPTGTYSLLFGLQALTHKWIPSHILEHQLHLLKPMH